MVISAFAEKQLKMRCGISKKAMYRVVDNAWNKGVLYRNTKGRLFKWISNLYYEHPRNGNDIRIYGDKAFVFCNGTLVTVVQIPHYLMKDLPTMIKTTERDGKNNGRKQVRICN